MKFIEKTLSFFEFNLILVLFVSILFSTYFIQNKIDYDNNINKQNIVFEKEIDLFIKDKNIELNIDDNLIKENKNILLKRNKAKELSENTINLIVKNKIKIKELNQIYKDKSKEEKKELDTKILHKILHTKEESYKLFILGLD